MLFRSNEIQREALKYDDKDNENTISKIDINKVENGKYKVQELKDYIKSFNVELINNKILKENLQDLLLFLIYKSSDKYDKCNCAQLKNALKCFDLPITGVKKDLIDRLNKHLE